MTTRPRVQPAIFCLLLVCCAAAILPLPVRAQTEDVPTAAADSPEPAAAAGGMSSGGAQLSLRDLVRAGGLIGGIIMLLSVAMAALIFEHVLTIRRRALMPPGLAETVHGLLAARQAASAREACSQQPSFLSSVLEAGLMEIGLGYREIEKAMEDAATERAARLFRKTEYLSVIGTVAPMLGLLGTVWGMIQAFLEFETKANPQVAELAPGIYKALVTTLLGLGVAVPAIAGFAVFRNRIDELVAEASLLAEHVFADYRRALLSSSSRGSRQRKETEADSRTSERDAT